MVLLIFKYLFLSVYVCMHEHTYTCAEYSAMELRGIGFPGATLGEQPEVGTGNWTHVLYKSRVYTLTSELSL
jgi:hypothetical protein